MRGSEFQKLKDWRLQCNASIAQVREPIKMKEGGLPKVTQKKMRGAKMMERLLKVCIPKYFNSVNLIFMSA